MNWENLTENLKDVGLITSIAVGILSTISEKFRNALLFWRKREHDKISLSKSQLDFVEQLQEFQKNQLKELIEQNTKIREELEQSQSKARKELTEYQTLIRKHRAHIKYLETLLKNNSIEFYPLTLDDKWKD